MAVLIDLKNPTWLRDDTLLRELEGLSPSIDWRVSETRGEPSDIEVLIVSGYQPGEALRYPNLRLIQKTGAGVENILADSAIPAEVQVARSNASYCAEEMAEYALAFVLQEQRHLRSYREHQNRCEWSPRAPRRANETTVAVLGLGRMGAPVAERFVTNGFEVTGWSRTSKDLSGVRSYTGDDGLRRTIGEADFIVSVLPTTESTRGILDANVFAMCRPAAILIAAGRGDQTNEADLLNALDQGQLGGAVLDVCAIEPLPANDPLWLHPLVQITPHIAGWHSYVPADLVENYRRIVAGEPILHRVDRALGY